jgi:hypothetical protein
LFFKEKAISPGNNELSLGKGLNSPRKHMFRFFCNQTISCSFLYWLVTYHWKVLEEKYNFVAESISIRIHMKKLQSNKVSNIFVPWGT